jgi:hypothetical protein
MEQFRSNYPVIQKKITSVACDSRSQWIPRGRLRMLIVAGPGDKPDRGRELTYARSAFNLASHFDARPVKLGEICDVE